ncbi:proton-conducting transporter membrane subunit [Belliella kenyensis]|uniref:Proton-conducting transporter membrane subunit n=1 Tax=Belliella kenyensis TaxID=1472724 RepID=A0ABV8EJE2_9BACT|nr:proton-conducting transporter membrane subunit [Belliella kenyensis]MCH7403514.1 Na+/H+ antiporter subunit D [Belliella kenyensis]MDN3604964.1 proton-conducting transporter membrane subunit [Belliella kenyensis]
MNNPYIVLPVIFQLLTSVLLMFFWYRVNAQRLITIICSIISVGIATWLFKEVYQNGILTMQAGEWQAPFGITFVADLFSTTMVLLTAISGMAVGIFSTGSIRNARLKFGYFPILNFLLMGLHGAFLTGDIFNLYVWFEIIIIASFVLITIGGEKAQIEGAIKYVTMNLLASAIFLTAIAILYGLAGSLNMADLSIQVAEIENRGLVNVVAILFLVGFGIKSAIFPLYFWLPASYHTPPPAISAVFGGLLTKVGVYALLRIFTLIFIPDEFLGNLLIVLACMTILSGGLGAILQVNMRKIFSYLIVCHIGFMLAGLGIYTELAIMGAIFYLIHDIIVKTNLFLASGLIFKLKGTLNIEKLGGLYKKYPKFSLLIAIPLFSLAGIPPLSGFWAKVFLIEGGYKENEWMLIGFIILGSFLTLWVIAKLWSEVFWKDAVDLPKKINVKYFHELKPFKRWAMVIPIILLAGTSLYIGLAAEHIIVLSKQIAAELINPTAYLDAVLGIKSQTP